MDNLDFRPITPADRSRYCGFSTGHYYILITSSAFREMERGAGKWSHIEIEETEDKEYVRFTPDGSMRVLYANAAKSSGRVSTSNWNDEPKTRYHLIESTDSHLVFKREES